MAHGCKVDAKATYVFRLYTAGNEINSQLARKNLSKLCEEYLKGKCRIEEIDVLKDFESALKDRVFVTPTLIRISPEPRTVIIGHLSVEAKVISAFRLGNENET